MNHETGSKIIPKVSVIVPVYNVEKYIEKCVDSIIHQTLKEIEIILVDDGSTDRSGILLDSYQKDDKRIVVIHKNNAGVSAARNDGIKCSKGRYLYIMDSDDYLELNALEKMYKVATEQNVDIVMADHSTFVDDGEFVSHHFFSHEFVTRDKNILEAIQRMVLHFNYSPYRVSGDSALGIAPPWTRLVKAELIKNNGLQFDSYVKGIFDDGLFALEEMQICNSLAYIQTEIYKYRLLSSSLVHKYNPNRVEINKRISERLNDFTVKNEKNEDFKKAVYSRQIMNFVNLLDTYYLNQQYKKNIFNKIRMIKESSNDQAYYEAFKKCDLRYLTKTQVIVARLIKTKLYFLIPAFFWVRSKAR